MEPVRWVGRAEVRTRAAFKAPWQSLHSLIGLLQGLIKRTSSLTHVKEMFQHVIMDGTTCIQNGLCIRHSARRTVLSNPG